jgi:hypothetical protein
MADFYDYFKKLNGYHPSYFELGGGGRSSGGLAVQHLPEAHLCLSCCEHRR